MRHNVRGRKLGRTTAHRTAMFRNQLASLVVHGRITTTLAKAKELRSVAEKVITHGRTDSIPARRWVRRWLSDRRLVRKVFDEIGPRFRERPGGYLRIVKLGPRKGDGAELAILEFVDHEGPGGDGDKKKGAGKGRASKSGTKGKTTRRAKAATTEDAAAEESAAPEKPAKKAAKKAAKKPAKKRGAAGAKAAKAGAAARKATPEGGAEPEAESKASAKAAKKKTSKAKPKT